MSRTITFYKLISPYTEDITKNCSLFGNEIDDNFMNLKELSIDSVELSGTTIIIKRIGDEQLTVDLSEIIPDEPTMSVSYDEELGKIQIDFNEETFIIDGLLNQVNSTKLFLKKVASDLTLTGNGTIQNPLTINLTYKTGMYEPAIEFLDLTSGDTLPTSGMSIGDSYVTKEVRNPFGYLYNLEGVNEIKQTLLAENSEWRVPTKEDWDIMLNALECDEFKNHNDTEVSIVLGRDAGKILKSREYWQESNETNAGNDTYLFSSIPSGYGDDTKLITHAYEWGEYWTDTESSDFEHYTKQFRFDETGVYQLSRNINDYFSLRLVKTYNGENLVEYEKINNVIVKTDLMPSDSGETRLVWTMEDLNFGEDNYGGLRTPLLDEITETDLFYNVWNGNIWLKRKMKEGETTVILSDSGDTIYNICMVVNHELINTNLNEIAISGQVLTNIEDIEYLEANKANVSDLLSVSGQVSENTEDISNLYTNKADKATTLSGYGITDAYTKTESDGKYETIENVDLLEGIVSGNIEDISNLQSDKADKATTLAGYGITDAYTKTESDGKYETIENVDLLEGIVSGNIEDISNLQSDKADKATTLAGYGITDAYTKTEIDNKISAVFKYKGSVSTYVDLIALTGMTVGDVYNVNETGDNYVWTGTLWDKLAGEVDLSAYLTSENASNTYETITNVNLLRNIVTGNTEDIGYLQSSKANASDLLSISVQVLANTTNISNLQSDKADKATTLSGYGITDAYTKTEIDNKISAVFRYKGSVATYVDLIALTGMTVGDVYNVNETGDNYAWTGSVWDKLAGEIDLSAYLTIVDASNTYETKVNVNSLSNIVSGHTEDISDLQTNKADKATTLSGYGITDAYTQTEIDTKISAVFRYKGSIPTYVDLTALTGMTVGDVYNVTETGDNYAWTGTEWDKLSGEIDLSAYLTINSASNTYETIENVNSLSDIVSGHTGDISDLEENKADKATTLSGYGITDAVTQTDILYADLLALINNNELIPSSNYRITNYTTTTVQTGTTSAGHDFDIIVTALSTNELSEDAKCVKKSDDTYFTNANLESWELKYCIDNDTSRFAWADTENGKGVIYYMKDNHNNEVPYDFKNIQYLKNGVWLYTFGGEIDNSVVGYNIEGFAMYVYSTDNIISTCMDMDNVNQIFKYRLSFNTFGNYCNSNTLGDNCYSNTFGNGCGDNTFGNECNFNTFGNDCFSNNFGENCGYNTFGNGCVANTFGTFCGDNTFGNSCRSNTFGNYCGYNNFYTETSGTTKKDYIRYIVLEDGCTYNNFYSEVTTSDNNYLQRIRIKGLEHTAPTDTIITLSEENTNYEWVIAKNSSGIIEQYCPEDHNEDILDLQTGKQDNLTAGENIVISDNVISADLNDYLTTDEASNTYETIENVNSLSDIVSGHTGDISDLYTNKADKADVIAISGQVLTNIEDVENLETNKQDKATTLSGYGITDAYTKTEIDNKISAVFRYKGSVPTYANLIALTGMTAGDVYNVTETGDNYAWTGTEWDKLSGEIDLSAYLTIDSASNTYETIANVNSLSNTVSGNTEDILDLQTNKADKATTLSGYGITDAYTQTEIDTKLDNIEHDNTLNKNSNTNFLHINEEEKTNFVNASDFVEDFISNATTILYADLLALINNNELIPSSSYRITDYITTTVQANTQSAGHNFDVIVIALSTNELSENAKCVRKSGDTYFENAKLEAWEIKYCIDNDTSRFAWADTVNGKGVIYYMKDEWNNECPYDFKNIQFIRKLTDGYLDEDTGVSIYVYTFTWFDENDEVKDLSLIGNELTNDERYKSGIFNNTIKETTAYSVHFERNTPLFVLGGNVFLHHHSFDTDTFYGCFNNSLGVNCYSNTFGSNCYSNTFGSNCYSNTFGDNCRSNTFGNICYSNTFSYNCYSNVFGNNCYRNTFDFVCYSNTFGDYCSSNTFGNECYSNTFGNDCQFNNFYTGTSGTTKKDYLRYIVLEDGVSNNNFYSDVTTSSTSYLQRIRIKGLSGTSATQLATTISLTATNTKYEWVICYTSGGELKQYCPND